MPLVFSWLDALMRIAIAATYERIAKANYRIPSKVSPDAADLIRRVSFCDSLSYVLSWLTLLLQLLQYDPLKRISLVEVLKHPWVVKYRPKGVVRGSVDP